MTDASGELAKVERRRRKVEEELDSIRRIEDSIRERQIRYLEGRETPDVETRMDEVALNRGRILTDALSLFGGTKVNFEQSKVARIFKRSEKVITKDAIGILFKWLDNADEAAAVSSRSANLNTILGTLAVMSGLRKHKWVELAELGQQVYESTPRRRERDEDIPVEERNKFLKLVDDYLVILERLRRLHWKEVEYLDDFGLQLQNGSFPDTDELQDYMYTVLLDRVKTFAGRYGFHNRSITLLDQYRRYYVDFRASPHKWDTTDAWERLKTSTSEYDNYKAFLFTEELDKGVTAGMWPSHAIALFLY
ncbi:hypothetical protein BESB_017130 [Besnoitia besnoiti]|uniref:Uncharacterized protein n=1 Tax=Besnoitia besnoiti TaxID=94643 RepID=A0A2A9M359_BESBE|nr:hypothetical protein BESB_017130 [Besnoitia besnoiti]PFH32395.1 hypothetical protein BESB_017130 [Besnoitia besnoiti]